jgi:hypothetical protein
MPIFLETAASAQAVPDFDLKLFRAVLLSAGAEIAAVARRKVRIAVGSGRLLYSANKGRRQASLPGQSPASW